MQIARPRPEDMARLNSVVEPSPGRGGYGFVPVPGPEPESMVLSVQDGEQAHLGHAVRDLHLLVI